MPQHRETASSVSVQDLLGDGVVAPAHRHRSQPRTGDRMKLAASAAVATGALVGTATQLAHAAPLLPLGNDHADTGEIALKPAAEPAAPAAPDGVAPAPAAASDDAQGEPVADGRDAGPATAVAAPVDDPAPAPFGLQDLPPEVSGPLKQAEDVIKDLQGQVAPAPAVRPVSGDVSSGYGSRWGSFHSGVDFADSLGTPVHSVENGTVIDAGPASGFGQWVRVKHDDGTTGVYGHVNEILTQVGQRVNAGDVIATVGNRGNSTGPHLHLEIWDPDDNKIDPDPYLASKGVILSQQSWGPR